MNMTPDTHQPVPAGDVTGTPVLRVRNLSVTFDTYKGPVHVLHDVSFDIFPGEILGVAGVSGNGQQELLRVLSGEDTRAPRGSVRLFGQDGSPSCFHPSLVPSGCLHVDGVEGPTHHPDAHVTLEESTISGRR